MKIDIEKLPHGKNEIREVVRPAGLDLDVERYREDINVLLDLDKQEGRISVKVDVSTVGHLLCDRCGDEFSQSLQGDCTVDFIRRNEPFPDEMPGDDLRSFMPGQNELDLTTEVVDALELAVPSKLICTEECRGVCYRCGKNLNIEVCDCASEKN